MSNIYKLCRQPLFLYFIIYLQKYALTENTACFFNVFHYAKKWLKIHFLLEHVGAIEIWEIDSEKTTIDSVAYNYGHDDTVNSLDLFCKNTGRALTAGNDSRVIVWDLEKTMPIHMYTGQKIVRICRFCA